MAKGLVGSFGIKNEFLPKVLPGIFGLVSNHYWVGYFKNLLFLGSFWEQEMGGPQKFGGLLGRGVFNRGENLQEDVCRKPGGKFF